MKQIMIPGFWLPLWYSNSSYVGCVPFVIITIRYFPHSWLNTRFVTRVTRQVPHVEQELPILPEHLISPVLSGVHCLYFLCWPLYCLSFDLRLLNTPFGILDWRLLNTPFGILDWRLLNTPFGILDWRLLNTPIGIFKLFTYTTPSRSVFSYL